MCLGLTFVARNAQANCDDNKSEGYEQAYQESTEKGCQINSRIVRCKKGWFTQYYSEPPCKVRSKPPDAISPNRGRRPGTGQARPNKSKQVNAWSNCSDEQQRTILSAFREARLWLINSDNRLQPFTQNPRSQQFQFVATGLQKHFGFTQAEIESQGSVSPQAVLTNIRHLEQNIGEPRERERSLPGPSRAVTGACGTMNSESSNSTPNETRIGVAGAPMIDTNHFNYAPLFFTRDSNSQATTILHEMSHTWLHFDDNSYEDQPSKYPGRPGVAIMNPASYAGFVRDIGKTR
jgi:hypothetical protein